MSAVRALMEEIQKHPGTAARVEIERLRLTRAIFLLNERDLLALVRAANSNRDLAIELMRNVGDRRVAEQFTFDLIRQIHNYVASVATARDHSRRVSRKYTDTAFLTDYTRATDAIRAVPVARFLEDVRNYFVHYRVPSMITSGEFNFKDGGHSVTVGLDVAEAVGWSEWDQKSLDYMADKDVVCIAEAVKEYSALTAALYDCLFSHMLRIHGPDLKAVEELHKRFMTP